MKRRWILVVGAALCVFLVIALIRGPDPRAPRFLPGAPASMPRLTGSSFDITAAAPFVNSRVWLRGASGTNHHVYLYDLNQEIVLGELINGNIPELRTRDGSRLLVQGSNSRITALTQRIKGLLHRIFGGKTPTPRRIESFWIVDVADNSAIELGEVAQIVGTSSRWHPSPDFRHGYTAPTATRRSSFILCDLDAATFEQIPLAGELKGWWDDRRILVRSGINHFDLFDVTTRTSQTLFSAEYIEAFLKNEGLTNDPAGLTAFPNWNGRSYDFYFSTKDEIYGPGNPPTFLARADRTGPSLKLLYRDFEFRWLGRLDNMGTQYVYPGEPGPSGRGGDGSVHLRKLTNGTTITLVPPDNKGWYSTPRFFENEVIYSRNNVLHRIGIDGSNDRPVLPVNEH